jgi:cyclopropane fatty-acyl-phospholipid synthase-like methyltransferase
MMKKPYSESCDQNKAPILSVIKPLFSSASNILEIASGTGQHAIYFAEKMPQLVWNTSDCTEYLEGINLWLKDAALTNVNNPVELNVSTSQWPDISVDGVFTANSVHIMHQQDVQNLIKGVANILKSHGDFIIYGPFNYNSQFTSESNARFDQWLKSKDELSGIKHFEKVVLHAKEAGLELIRDYEMPANNRILHFRKIL